MAFHIKNGNEVETIIYFRDNNNVLRKVMEIVHIIEMDDIYVAILLILRINVFFDKGEIDYPEGIKTLEVEVEIEVF